MNVSKEIAGKHGRKGLKVVFTSDKKKSGGGARCTAQCIDPAPTTTPTPTTTTTTTTTTATATTGKLLCGQSVESSRVIMSRQDQGFYDK